MAHKQYSRHHSIPVRSTSSYTETKLPSIWRNFHPWWRHQIERFSALLALCAGNSPVAGEFSAQRPVTRSFGVFFDLRLNKWLSKQSWGWWFETLSRPLWRHFNAFWQLPVQPVAIISRKWKHFRFSVFSSHWGLDKMTAFSGQFFIHYLDWKCMSFDQDNWLAFVHAVTLDIKLKNWLSYRLEPLSEPMMTQYSDASMRHQTSTRLCDFCNQWIFSFYETGKTVINCSESTSQQSSSERRRSDTLLQWRHNDHDGDSNHQPHDCLLTVYSRRGSKKASKLRVTGLCAGNSPETGEFPAQMASIAENVSIWWRHHVAQ